jgi:hypothetical protein
MLLKLQEVAEMVMVRCCVYMITLHESYSYVHWKPQNFLANVFSKGSENSVIQLDLHALYAYDRVLH